MLIMIIWASLTVAVFGTLPIHTWAEVVNSFQRCSEHFYKGKEPRDFDQNAKQICQSMEFSGHFYATLYSTYHRIPLYSAYKFDFDCRASPGQKTGDWFIEPQLSQEEKREYTNTDHMINARREDLDLVKVKQAINADYSNTGYDRGHLNTNSFQFDDGRKATFTLTNSAPMDACFNRVHWKEWESAVKGILLQQDQLGTAYLVTGAVPDINSRIPKQGIFDDPTARDYNRVTVPTHIWTAVCYIHPIDEEKSFSFGYIGANKPHGSIEVRTIPQLTQRLAQLYRKNNLKIFEDNCFFQKPKSEQITKNLYRKIQLPLGDRLTMSPDIMNTFHTALSHSDDESTSYPAKRVRVTQVKIDVFYDSVVTWLKEMEEIKFVSGLACSLSAPFSGSVVPVGHDELRHKRQTSQELVCTLVPENLDGCTTSCLYNEEAGDYYCSTETKTKLCSPTYSDITISGKKCRSDHTCGQYGYSYYWCNTDSSWDYCSPPLPLGVKLDGSPCRTERNCAKYGKSDYWCDSQDGQEVKCCRRADRFSAVNGKTCKKDHPCDKYNEDFLWCYTTVGSWDYCCTK